jgi:hypothetical protein
VAARNSIEDPLTDEQFDEASQGPAQAQRALVNDIRRSLGKDLGALNVWLGGALTKPENWP